MRISRLAIGLGAVVLLGGGAALLVLGHGRRDTEAQTLSLALRALEEHGQSLQRIEQHSRQVHTIPVIEVVARPEQPPNEQASAHRDSRQDLAATPETDGRSPPQIEPSLEQLEQELAARQLLERAVKAGGWQESEREAFRAQFRQLTKPQQAGLAQSLSAAVNEGKLHVDPAKMPW